MKIGIIAALNSELKNIENIMSESAETVEINNGKYLVGKIGKLEVVACVCSIGKVNAAIKTQTLIDKFSVDRIINTGIAGSLDEKAKHLAIVVSDKVFYHDFDLKLFARYYPFTEYFQADKEMVGEYLAANEKENDLVVGDIATGDVFVSDSETKNKIKQNYRPLCAEMEGAAVAHTAFVNGVPFMVIRCISDMADEAADFDYNAFEVTAADKVSNTVIRYLKSL